MIIQLDTIPFLKKVKEQQIDFLDYEKTWLTSWLRFPKENSAGLCELDDQGNLKGFLLLNTVTLSNATLTEQALYHSFLYVLPEFRRKGIARGLLTRVSEIDKKQYVLCNRASFRLYESANYKLLGYFSDTIIYVKNLDNFSDFCKDIDDFTWLKDYESDSAATLAHLMKALNKVNPK